MESSNLWDGFDVRRGVSLVLRSNCFVVVMDLIIDFVNGYVLWVNICTLEGMQLSLHLWA